MSRREIPEVITLRLKAWRSCFRVWRVLHYSFGIAATICSVLVAAHKSLPATWSISALSLVAALCSGLLTFLNAGAKSKGYMQAWRIVDGECIQFQLDPKYPEAKLADAVAKAEAVIAKTDT